MKAFNNFLEEKLVEIRNNKFGRESFCKDHEINIKKDKFTVKEFINLTEDAFGGNIITRLRQAYAL